MSVVAFSLVEQHIRTWLQSFIVELNLCPFARPLIADPALRIHVCEANNLEQLHHAFLSELDLVQQSSEGEIATSLLVMPNILQRFEDYLEFLGDAEAMLEELGLDHMIQLASFHPQYLFDGEDKDSASHFSNRSPYPLIHFLREEMVTAALDNVDMPQQIPERNIALLEGMGRETVAARWAALTADEQK
ncbi:hypothetical protein GB2207_10226 [marine gamma proteobacterium HTCC2207]|jgi:hypothetical protein|uniref:Uncharacterized protein n=1 Tax=gamma proteobacterium HTCC2207 TaxID=314287 RepID=Q1YU78_9GAMM|nr:hypothetical protein GB2207_10226 [marine gamma proteobacterium HTCC2207] [gamma proteobacterium HTCC2207]MBT6115629.1 DUF1415 domain-containing protein [Porticoccaceae bacterium]MDB4426855.1 DUF1415 domain-containing protein [Porticoccaceae bacterium]MDC0589889.1 DUF1415 domain-containing protein [Porticoccaceae bacterium]